MAEHSEAEPTSASASSKGKAVATDQEEMTYSFYMKMRPLKLLKYAFASLVEPSMNPSGFGRLTVNEKSFRIDVQGVREIKVENRENTIFCTVFCALELDKLDGMIKYECGHPIEDKIFSMGYISVKLYEANPEDVISIYNVFGSDKLCFKIGDGSVPSSFYSENLLDINPTDCCEFPPIKNIRSSCVLPTECLRSMIPHLVTRDKDTLYPVIDLIQNTARKVKPVKLEITRERVGFGVGVLQWKIENNVKLGTMKLEGGNIAEEIFLPYPDVLEEASMLSDTFCLFGVELPTQNFLWRFKLNDLGALLYLSWHDIEKGSASSKQNSMLTDEEMTYNFFLQMKPLRKLSCTFKALMELSLNPNRIGCLYVDQDHFAITVDEEIEMKTEDPSNPTICTVICNLLLEKGGMTKYHCRHPLRFKKFSLGYLSAKLAEADQEAAISIYYVGGSDRLSFKIADGRVTGDVFSEHICDLSPTEISDHKKIPVVKTFRSENVIPTERLRSMIPHLIIQDKAQKVKLEITLNRVKFGIGELQWKKDYDEKERATRRLREQRVVGEVFLPYADSLREASNLAENVKLLDLGPPHHTFIWEFNLGIGGYSAFIYNSRHDFKKGESLKQKA